MSQEDITTGARSLADSVWLVLAARFVSIIGVPLASFLFLQMWGDIRASTAMLQALSIRMSVSETDRAAVKDRVAALEMEMRELRRMMTGRP